MVGRPVIDTTGLKGKYDITLHYIQDPPGRNGALRLLPRRMPDPPSPALCNRNWDSGWNPEKA
jgi:uncharacterized protein (TIGR03435 family)